MVSKGDVVQKLRTLLPEGAVAADEFGRAGVAFSVTASLERIRDAAAVFNEAGYFLESLTCLDFQDTFELVYHFNAYEPQARIVVRSLCGHDQVPPTVSDIFKTADWQEREVHEFFGLPFEGHPDLRRLLLPEDADYFPLKKTFGKVNAYRKREEIYG